MGGTSGQLLAFERPRPQLQPAAIELQSMVGSEEFAGDRALVVGGSRGLGELTAKLLAAGGAQVCLTYKSGASDAEYIIDDISRISGNARSLPYDVLAGPEELLDTLLKLLDELLISTTITTYVCKLINH